MSIEGSQLSSKDASLFTRFARWTSRATGTPAAFVTACSVVIVWAVTGPLFGFSDTWQLVINTGTTIVTFLMVFAIQASQNRDFEAIQVKLDELIRSIAGAQNSLLDLEELEESEIERLRKKYRELCVRGAERCRRRHGLPAAAHLVGLSRVETLSQSRQPRDDPLGVMQLDVFVAQSVRRRLAGPLRPIGAPPQRRECLPYRRRS